MSKRRPDEQLTKDQFEAMGDKNFMFSAGHGADDGTERVQMASKSVMAGRKIAPMKKSRFKGSSGGGGANIPNFFAGTAAVFGAGAPQNGAPQNGVPQQQPPAAPNPFAFGVNSAPVQAPSANNPFGGNNVGATGGFLFGNNTQPEQAKPNLFAPPDLMSNTSGGGVFGAPAQTTGLFGNPPAQPSVSSAPLFGSGGGAVPASTGFAFGAGNANNVAPPQPSAQNTSFNKPSSFSLGSAAIGSGTGPGIFGGNSTESKPASASSSFTFGQTTTTAPPEPSPTTSPSSSFAFGQASNTASASASASAPASAPAPATNFFGGTSASAAPVSAYSFGGINAVNSNTGTGLFGAPKKEEPKVLAPPEQPLFKPTPSPEPPASNMFGQKPSTSPESTSQTASTLFGAKPAAPTATGMFGNLNGLNPVTASQTTPELFGAQSAKEEQKRKPVFSFGSTTGAPPEKKEEPAKPLFGAAPTSSAAPTSLFGNNESKPATTTASTGLFGQLNKEEPKASAPAPAPEKELAPVFSNPITFPPPATTNTFSSVNTTNSLANNNFTSSSSSSALTAAKPITTTTAAAAAADTTTAKTTATANTTTTTNTASFAPSSVFSPASATKELSPPIPPEAAEWTPAQLVEYHNLYALRCLNHVFSESLRISDPMGDWSAACEAYTKEAARINEYQLKGEKYRPVLEGGKLGPGVSGKRSGDNEIDGLGGNKRRRDEGEDSKSETSKTSVASSMFGSAINPGSDWKLADQPAIGFKLPTDVVPTSQSTEVAAAPVFGFKPSATAAAEPKKVESVGDSSKSSPASVFDNPGAATSPSGFVNPFTKKPDGSQDDASDEATEEDEDDDDSKKSKTTGGHFGRVSEPKKQESGLFGSKPFTGIFSGNNTSGLFGNGTSSTTGLFGAKTTDSKPAFSVALFGGSGSGSTAAPPFFGFGSSNNTTTANGLGFGFGTTAKPSGPISMPGNSTHLAPPTSSALSRTSSTEGGNTSSATTPVASDLDNSEPCDTPPARNDLDLSVQGPGEEDEDSLFQVRAIVYELGTGAPVGKIGVGTLRVLKNRDNGKARVLVRTDGGKVVLNVGLKKELRYEVREKKSVSVVQFLEDGTRKMYSVRVKEEGDAKKLGETMENAKK